MATRAKPREIVAEAQKSPSFFEKIFKWAGISVAIVSVVIAAMWGVGGLRHDVSQTAPAPDAQASQVQATAQPCNLQSSIPLTCWPDSMKPTLEIPAGGRSELILARPGMRIVLKGNNILNHTVYLNGSECVFTDMDHLCPNGAIKGNYATNTSLVEKTIFSYAFEDI